MEFCEKLQELRKSRGLTQEELAEKLYVSRTAISKWESGRGFPSIDSVRAISKFFSVSLDELFSDDAILTVAKADSAEKERRTRTLVFGLLDCCAALLLFLPLFGQSRADGVSVGVSLLSLSARPYVKTVSLVLTFAAVLWGVAALALQNIRNKTWARLCPFVSALLGACTAVFFMLCRQPYAAVFVFVLLIIKTALLLKRR